MAQETTPSKPIRLVTSDMGAGASGEGETVSSTDLHAKRLAPAVPSFYDRGMVVLPPGATMVLEFPDLPPTLQSLVDGVSGVPAVSAYLPKNYRTDRQFPLFCFLEGGSGGDGRSPRSARRIIGDRGHICVTMPLFKRRLAKTNASGSNYWSRMFIKNSDSKTAWDAYQVMLPQLFAMVPNIDRDRCTLGGFSNGAHAIVTQLNRRQAKIREYFSRFVLAEGGCHLVASDAIRALPILILEGALHKHHWLKPAHQAARQAKARVRYERMARVGHALPKRYELVIRRWLKDVS